MSKMLSLEEAQSRVLAMAPEMAIETMRVEQAQGRFLACDLIARRTQPPADLSAMDGYAINGHGPWRLVGESRAGAPFSGEIGADECTRISTGAHMPPGSDRVLIQENASVDDATVSCTQDMPHAGKHVRQRGFDFAEGDTLLNSGQLMGPAQIALAVTAGHGKIEARKAPSIAVLDSGDELSADPANCGPDQIPASNGAMLAAMLDQLGCKVIRIGPVADDETALAGALKQAENADILVTSGGASVGDHDLIRPALEQWGARLDFWKVAMKPGKPLMLARRDRQVIIGLPGNPVSSYVTAALFLLPLVRASMGSAAPLPFTANIKLACNLPASGSRHEFLRAVWSGRVVDLVDSQDSSALRALANSNCLIERPPHSDEAEAGTFVPVLLLENGGIA
jgi:molybdopterin molybdotransferase